jgi:hypothetical protein
VSACRSNLRRRSVQIPCARCAHRRPTNSFHAAIAACGLRLPTRFANLASTTRLSLGNVARHNRARIPSFCMSVAICLRPVSPASFDPATTTTEQRVPRYCGPTLRTATTLCVRFRRRQTTSMLLPAKRSRRNPNVSVGRNELDLPSSSATRDPDDRALRPPSMVPSMRRFQRHSALDEVADQAGRCQGLDGQEVQGADVSRVGFLPMVLAAASGCAARTGPPCNKENEDAKAPARGGSPATSSPSPAERSHLFLKALDPADIQYYSAPPVPGASAEEALKTVCRFQATRGRRAAPASIVRRVAACAHTSHGRHPRGARRATGRAPNP